jgi:hypothetical protein
VTANNSDYQLTITSSPRIFVTVFVIIRIP